MEMVMGKMQKKFPGIPSCKLEVTQVLHLSIRYEEHNMLA